MMFGNNFSKMASLKLNEDGTPSAASNAVPEELLRQIHLNLRISTTPGSASSESANASTVTKVLISGDSHSSSVLSAAANGGTMFFEEPLKYSSLRGFENYQIQPLFKVERPIDPKRI